MKVAIVVLALAAVAFAHLNVLADHDAPLDRNGIPKIPCLTQHLYEQRVGANGARACATQGNCDNAAYRDSVGNTNKIITINLAFHVMNSATGQAPDGIFLILYY